MNKSSDEFNNEDESQPEQESEESGGVSAPGDTPDSGARAAEDGEESRDGEWEDAPSSDPELSGIAREATEVTQQILTFFPKVQAPRVSWKLENGSIWVEIEGDPSGRLIGRRGKTIEAFQHLLSKIVSHRFRKRITIHLDAEGYRRRHRDRLEKLAIQTADYVAATESARALEPMSPADRRIVHMTLKERGDVTTASEGREPERFVVIWPRGED